MFGINNNKINPNEEYRPREIADNGWIKPPRGEDKDSAYHFILRIINRGQLQAKNRAEGMKVPHYVVIGNEILRYQKSK